MAFKKLLNLFKKRKAKEIDGAKSKDTDSPEIEVLEPRIMLSATWMDADVDDLSNESSTDIDDPTLDMDGPDLGINLFSDLGAPEISVNLFNDLSGPDQTVNAGTTVALNASLGSNQDNDALTYQWTQVQGPSITLSDDTSDQPTFTAPDVEEPTVLIFTVTTDDGTEGGEQVELINVTVTPESAPESPPLNIVLVDSTLTDTDTLTSAVEDDAIVVEYDGDNESMTDVLSRVEALAESQDHQISSLSILSHGDSGEFDLGNETVTLAMSEEQRAAWQSLADNFTADANLFVYGCNVADGTGEGQALLDTLGVITGTDVFGSDDTTGAGGDWDLEAASEGDEPELESGLDTSLVEEELAAYAGTLTENDPPVNTVPGTQTTAQDTDLVFSSGNGNQISISDVDAGSEEVEVTLSADHGTMSLNMPSVGGDETLVNTTTDNTQSLVDIAHAADGTYVVTWVDSALDGSSNGIFMQRFDADGAPVGSEIQVNTYTTGIQSEPTVAMDDSGNFVIAWHSYAQGEATAYNTYAQRFDSNGDTVGSELLVNSYTSGSQVSPDIVMDSATGEFTVTWYGTGVGGDTGVFMKRFSFAGAVLVDETLVSSAVNTGSYPSIAMNDTGDMVVVWKAADADREGIWGQRFDDQGNAAGSIFAINTTTYQRQQLPQVAIDGDGNFVVAWESLDQDGSSYGIFAQRFNSAGVKQGDEIEVNTETNLNQSLAAIACDQNGDFVISWRSLGQDGSGYGIYAKKYDGDGNILMNDFLVNTTTSGTQDSPAVDFGTNGEFAVVWHGEGSGDSAGVFLKHYTEQSLNFWVGDGVDDTTMTFTGTIDDINTALDGLTFTPTPGYSGSASVQITTDDLGNTGGAAESDDDTIDIIVGTGGDSAPPLVVNNTGSTVTEGGTDTLSNTELRYDDSQQPATSVTYTVTSASTNGQLELTTDPGVAVNTFTQDDIDNNRVVYIHGGSETSSDSFTFDVDDGQGNSVTGQMFSLSVTAVNDAPTITSDGGGASAGLSVAENTVTITTVAASDAEGDAPTYSISGGADAALFSVDANTGVLSFKAAPDFESPADFDGDNVYEVIVQADDRNGGTDTQAISVTVTNVDPAGTDDAYSVDADATLDVDWWDTDWTHRQEISFDNLAQSETLTEFPVLLVLDPTKIDYTQTNDDGSDLRFFDADGNALAYEIEQWNEGGESSVWVRVPQITGGSDIDSIMMYYGNAAAEMTAGDAGVWDDHFVGVWHLNEEQAGTDSTGVYKDSTSYGNDGIDRTASTGQEGQVTDGQEFGANDWVEIDHDPSLDLKDSMTISFWIKPTSDSGTFNRVVEKGEWGYNDSYYFGGGNGTNDLTFYLNGQEVIETPDGVLTVGDWQHCAVSYTSNGNGTGTARMYIDGVEVATGDYTNGVVPGNTGRLGIGHSDPDYDFDGFIDEVQISNIDRSADWITAQYQATKNQFGAEFVEFSGEEPAPATGGVMSNDLPDGSAAITVSNLDTTGTQGLVTMNPDGTFDYDPNGQFDNLAAGITAIDTFSYEVTEANGATHTANVTITVTGVNDAPTAIDNVITTDEDTTYTFSAADFNFSDVDGDSLTQIQITSLENSGFLQLNGTDVTLDQVISRADIDAGNLTFTPASDANGAGYDSFQFKVHDGTGYSDAAYLMTVDVTAVDDAPTITVPSTQTIDEDTNIVFSSANGNLVSVSNVDDAGEVIGVSLSVQSGTLTLDQTTSLTFVKGDGTDDGAMAFTGTQADINAALDGMTFTPVGDFNGDVDLDITASDIGDFESSVLAHSPISYWKMDETSGTAATDETGGHSGVYTGGVTLGGDGIPGGDEAPTFDGSSDYVEIPHSDDYLLDDGTVQVWFKTPDISTQSTLFSKDATDNGTGGHITTYLVDGEVTFRLQSATNSYSLSGGSLAENEWHHAAFSFGSEGMKLYVDGQLVDSNGYTGGLGTTSGDAGNYEPLVLGASTMASGDLSADNLEDFFEGQIDEVSLFGDALSDSEIESIYRAGLGIGGGASSSDTLTVTVNPVQDAPTASQNTVRTDEDTAYTFTAADFNFEDVDGESLTQVQITSLESAGTLLYEGSDVTADQVITRADIDAGKLTFIPAADANGQGHDSFEFKVHDGIEYSASSYTMEVDVTPVDDATIITIPGIQNVDEDASLVFSTGNGNLVSVSDVDVGEDIQITLSVNDGLLSLAQTTGLTFIAGDGTDDATMTFTGSVSDINSAFDGLTFSPDADFSGPVNLDITATGIIDFEGSVLTHSPVSYWKLDEASGTTAADETGGHIGTYTGGVTLGGDGITNGDKAPTFDGSSDYIEIPHSDDYLLDDGTVQVWFKTPDISTQSTLFSKDATGNGTGGHITTYVVGGEVTFRLQSATNSYYLSGGSLDVNEWHHAAFSFGSEGMKLYVDGQLVDSNGYTGGLGTTSGDVGNYDPLVLGASTMASGDLSADNLEDFFVGQIDEVSIFGAALSDSEIQALYNAGQSPGATSSDTVMITVNAVQDAPTAANNTVSTNEDTTYTFTASDFNFTDVDGDSLTQVQITSLESAGTLLYEGSDVTADQVITRADIDAGKLTFVPAADANGAGHDSFQFKVHDGTEYSAADYQMTVDVAPVNDLPTSIDNTVTINEDTTLTFTAADFNFADVDGDSLTQVQITSLESAGTLLYDGSDVTADQVITRADIDAGKLTFVPAADANGAGYDEFQFKVHDGTEYSASVYTMTVDVMAVDDAPTLIVPGAQNVNEDTTLVFSSGNGNQISITEVDSDTVAVTLSVENGTLTLAQTTNLTFATGDGTSDVTMTFVGGVSDINAALNGMTFDAAADYTGSVDLDVTVEDVADAETVTASLSPVAYYKLNETSGNTASDSSGNGLDGTLTNMDPATDWTTGRIDNALEFDGSNDFIEVAHNNSLSITDELTLSAWVYANPGGLSGWNMVICKGTSWDQNNYYMGTSNDEVSFGFYNNGWQEFTTTGQNLQTGTWYHIAATIDDANDTVKVYLDGIEVLADTTTETLVTNSQSLTIGCSEAGEYWNGKIDDVGIFNSILGQSDLEAMYEAGAGIGGGSTVTDSVTITIDPVQDAPTAGANTVTTNEDSTYTFTAADFNFTDVDGDSLAQVQVTSLESAGSLQLNGVDVTLDQVISKADIDAGRLTFSPAADANGAGYDSFQFKVHDGTEYSASAYGMTIDVTAVQDAPTAAANTVTTNEDTTFTFTAADFNFADVDGDSLTQVQITSLESAGTLQLNGVDVILDQVISRADIDAGLLTFSPAADANGLGYDSFQFKVHDGTEYSAFAYDMTMDVTAVQDAPTAVANTVTTNEDTTYTFTAADFNFADVDGDSLTQVQITSLESAGSLQLNGVDVTLDQVISRADIDAGLLTFTPAADANGLGYDSFQFKVHDGTEYSASAYGMTIDVTAVQDAPTASANTVTTDEDTSYTFTAADFNFADVDGDSLTQVQITSLESAGTLQLNGVDVTLDQVISRADIDAGLLTFSPAADANGAGYDSFQFKVHDGTEYSASAYGMTIDVTAVQDAPTAAANTVTTNEDTTFTFTAADFNFADVDGDSLTQVQITSLESAGTLQLNGVDVILDQVISRADIDAGLLTFSPAADANGLGYDSFQFKVHDGTEYSAFAYDMTMDVTAVQDAPTAVANTVTTNEDTTYTFTAADFNFADVDGDSLTQVQITSLESAGSLQLNGVDVTLDQVISRADIDAGLLTFTPAADANGLGYDSFQFKVHDGTEYSASAYGMTIDVTAVQDAPTASANTVTTDEDTSYTFTATDFNFTDVDGDSLTQVQITSLESAGSLQLNGVDVTLDQVISRADIDAGLLTFVPANGSSGTGYDAFQFKVHDGTEYSSSSYEMTIDVGDINDPPTSSANTVTTNEDTTYTFTAADFNFADVDGDSLTQVQITSLESAGSLQLNGADVTLDQVISRADIDAGLLTFTPAADANGLGYDSFQFKVHDGTEYSASAYDMTMDVTAVQDAPTAVANTVTTDEDTTYTFTAADFNFADVDGDSLTQVQITSLESAGSLQLNGVDVVLDQVISRADIDAGRLTFTPAADANGVGFDSFQFKVHDGTEYSAADYQMTVDVAPVNDAPVLLTGSVDDLTVNEDAGLVSLGLESITYGPGGGGDESVQNLSYDVTAIPDPNSFGKIFLADGTTQVTTGSYTLTELQGMQFESNANESGVSFFSFNVQDDGGTGNGGADILGQSIMITVDPVNDDPLNSGSLPTDVTVTEDVTSSVDLSSVTLSDVDAGNNLIRVRLRTSTGGVLNASSEFDVTVVGNGSNVLTLTGGVSDLNNFFSSANRFQYRHGTAHTNGDNADTIQVEVNDLGNTGTGGSGTVILGTVNVDITPVNDLPTSIDNTVTTNEDTTYTFTAADFNFADVDGDSLTQVQITSLESAGSLQLNGVDVTLDQVISRADIDAGRLTFTPAADENGAGYDAFQFKVHDGTEYSASSYDMTIDVAAVQDAPTASSNTVTTNEDTTYTFTAADFNFADVDGDSLTQVQITSLESAGSMQLNGADVTLDQVISRADIDAGRLTFVPVNGESGIGYDSFQFRVHDGTEYSSSAYGMTIDVGDVNDAPTAAANTVITSEDTTYTFTAADFNFADVDGDSLTQVQITSLESAGSLQLNGADVTLAQVISRADIDAGRLTFTPAADANSAGYDDFQFRVHDGTEYSSSAYGMTIDVTAVQDAPTASANTVTTNEDTTYTFTAADFNFADVDGDSLTQVQVTSLESAGSLQLNGVDVTLNQVISSADINAGRLTFTPAANAIGAGYDDFQFRVHDGTEYSTSAYQMTVNVAPSVNEAPIAEAGAHQVVWEGETIALDGSGSSDPEGQNLTYNWIQIDGPAAELSDANASQPTFRAPEGMGDYTLTFQVSVSDGTNISIDTVVITVLAENDDPADGDDSETPPDDDVDTTDDEQADDDDTEDDTGDETDDDTQSDTSPTEEPNDNQSLDVEEPTEPNSLHVPEEPELLKKPVKIEGPPGIKTGEMTVPDSEGKLSADNSRSVQETIEPIMDEDEFHSERVEAALRADAILTNEKITESIDKVKEDIEEDVKEKTVEEKIIVGIVSGIVSLSVGMVAWALRGVSLLASLLVSLPVWKSIDPLPILDAKRKKQSEKKKDKTGEEQTLKETDESIVDSFFDPSEKESKDHQNKGNPR